MLIILQLLKNIFHDTECDSVVESKNHYENCLVDICAFKDPKEYFCSALNAYAMECARSNIKFDWRSEVKECGKFPKKQVTRPFSMILSF